MSTAYQGGDPINVGDQDSLTRGVNSLMLTAGSTLSSCILEGALSFDLWLEFSQGSVRLTSL